MGRGAWFVGGIKMKNNDIRIATKEDAKKLVEIYTPYVEKTAITFEYVVPTAQEFEKRIGHVLEKVLSVQNILNLNACIAYPRIEDEYLTQNSVQFHEHFGYRFVGEFHKCGYKFGRWYNMVWMEKHISDHTDNPPAIKTFNEIREVIAEKYGIL